MDALPIDPLLPEIVSALRAAPSLVIEAPPGAGKTTRVPSALLAGRVVGEKEIVVLEPRRLAARLAARRVADELGEAVGGTAGYQVRFEDVTSSATRIRFVTEGLLTRRLLSEPTLPGVGAVILDEFHERHLQGDLALALLRRLQRTARPDLKLVAMSATLDAAPVARFLGAPALRSEGRRFEVVVEHLSPEEAGRDARLEERVARAVRRLHREAIDGDVLVFLPGAAEIRRAREVLAPWAEGAGVDLLPLHGDLPPDEQDRAVRPGARRKVILSTNVAETSVTIEGVTAVVDSGLARIASHSPWSGLPTLEVRKISRASAAQRAGRAGRLGPGRKHLLQAGGIGVSRADGVDVDAEFRALQRQRLREADHAGPGRHRQREPRDRLDRGNRRDVENRAAAARLHRRHRLARHAYDVHQVLLDRLGPGGVVERQRRTERRRPVVVDQDVDAAEFVAHPCPDARTVFRPAAVRLHRHHVRAGLAADAIGGGDQVVLAPRRHCHRGAFARQRAGDAVADALARAADDGHLALQFEVHVRAASCRNRSAFFENTFSSTSSSYPSARQSLSRRS